MGRPPECIFLCGFSGSGKTDTGRHLALLLQYEFIDTDDMVAKAMGKTIPEIFGEQGERSFRAEEKEAVYAAISWGRVIALGGGALLDDENLRLVKSRGCLIHLTVTPETAMVRLQHGDCRPVIGSVIGIGADEQRSMVERIRGLMADRETGYGHADMVIDTEGKTPADVAAEIMRRWQENG